MTPLAYPSVDAISEFVTLRGTYEAEYGRSASGQINVVTNSGTNAFHGGAYEYFRNDVFNANNYFNKLTPPHSADAPAALQRLRLYRGRTGGDSALLQRQGQDVLLLLAGVPAGGAVPELDVVCADGRGTGWATLPMPI